MALTSANGSAAPIVLVVEDEFVVRHTVTQYLQDAGCVVVEAESAERAIALCRAGVKVDVLVTDIKLNGHGNGWDVADAFRAVRPGIAVVYASATYADRVRCVPGSVYFNKPYRLSDILRACRDLPRA